MTVRLAGSYNKLSLPRLTPRRSATRGAGRPPTARLSALLPVSRRRTAGDRDAAGRFLRLEGSASRTLYQHDARSLDALAAVVAGRRRTWREFLAAGSVQRLVPQPGRVAAVRRWPGSRRKP